MMLTNDQIEAAINNLLMLMDGEFNFSPQKILNKNLIFDISMLDKETIIDKTIDDHLTITTLKMINIGSNMNQDLTISN